MIKYAIVRVVFTIDVSSVVVNGKNDSKAVRAPERHIAPNGMNKHAEAYIVRAASKEGASWRPRGGVSVNER
jgi:tRNA(Arg) A34 adenosine deaminase TadA